MSYRGTDTEGYYPSWRARFIVRLEDFGTPGTPEPPARIPTLRKGTKDTGKPGDLKVVADEGRLVLIAPTANPVQMGGPQDQIVSSDGLTHVIDGIIPQSANFGMNGVRTADTLDLTMSFIDFPFDPRCLRSVAVKFFMGTVSASDAARGAAGDIRDPQSSGVVFPYGTLPDTWIDTRGRVRSNLRFEGFADTDKIEFDSASASVQMSCVDNTSLFLTQEHPSQLALSPKQPIDRAMANYLASFPQFVGMAVEYRPHVADDRKPTLASALSKTAAQGGKGPPQGAGQKVMVWDYLTDVVGSVGHILRVEGTTVIIQRPRTLYGSGFRREDDPFTGRTIEGVGTQPLVLPVRMYGLGLNVNRLSIARNYEKGAPKNIEVRSYSTARKKTIIARFPEKGERVKDMKPGQTGTDVKLEVVRVQGIDDPATLKIVAQAHYERANRNEFEVQLETVNIGSFGGGNLDPDLLDIREGDAIRIEILRSETDDITGRLQNLAIASADELVGLGFRREFAEQYVRTREQIQLPTTFRVREARFEMQNSKAIRVSLTAVNYIVAAIEKKLSAEQEITPSDVEEGFDRISVDDQVG